MVAHVRSQVTCVLTTDEAYEIRKKVTRMFGYLPEVFKYPDAWRLVVHSDADAQKVQELRDQFRAERRQQNHTQEEIDAWFGVSAAG